MAVDVILYNSFKRLSDTAYQWNRSVIANIRIISLLKSGMTEAVFHNFGDARCSNVKLKTSVKGLDIDVLVYFNILLLMPSRPVALLTLRVHKMSTA